MMAGLRCAVLTWLVAGLHCSAVLAASSTASPQAELEAGGPGALGLVLAYEDAGGEAGPTSQQRPVDAAKGGVITAKVLDGAGVMTMAVGGLVDSDNSLSWMALGTMIMGAGGLVGTTSMSARNHAVRSAGFTPRSGAMAASWLMLVATGATFGGYVAYVASEPTGSEAPFVALGLVSGAALLEAFNYAIVRDRIWQRTLEEAPCSEAATSRRPLFFLTPVLLGSASGEAPIAGLQLVAAY